MKITIPALVKKLLSTRRRIVGAAVIGVIALAIIIAARDSAVDDGAWAQVERGTFTVELVESGEILAVESEFVKAPRYSDLQIIDMVPEGTIVEEGDFLAQFDTTTLKDDLETMYDNLTRAEDELKQLELEQQQRMSEMESARKSAVYSREAAEMRLEQLKYESEVRREEARLEHQKELLRFEEEDKKIEARKISDELERHKSRMKVEQRLARVEGVEDYIEKFTLHAPIGGMVVYREIGGWNAPRQRVAIGDKPHAGEAIMSIPDLSSMKVVIKVNEFDVARLRVGQKAFIRLDAYEDTVYTAAVNDIAPIIEKGVREYWGRNPNDPEQIIAPTFEVTIILEKTRSLLKPGLTAQARIVVEEIAGVLSIPIGCVFEDDTGTTVVFTRKSFPNPVPVRLGKRNDRFAVVEQGLRAGDRVARTSPETGVHPLGRYAEMERRRSELEDLLAHIDTMTELGITGEVKEAPKANGSKPPQPELKSEMGTSGRQFTETIIIKNPEGK